MCLDIRVPITKVLSPELSKSESSNAGLASSVLGHVGDGNFHQVVMYDPQKPHEEKAVKDCVHNMMIRALEMEGTVSVNDSLEFRLGFIMLIFFKGEHGIGLGKKVG